MTTVRSTPRSAAAAMPTRRSVPPPVMLLGSGARTSRWTVAVVSHQMMEMEPAARMAPRVSATAAARSSSVMEPEVSTTTATVGVGRGAMAASVHRGGCGVRGGGRCSRCRRVGRCLPCGRRCGRATWSMARRAAAAGRPRCASCRWPCLRRGSGGRFAFGPSPTSRSVSGAGTFAACGRLVVAGDTVGARPAVWGGLGADGWRAGRGTARRSVRRAARAWTAGVARGG
jgi:hypothetical protein